MNEKISIDFKMTDENKKILDELTKLVGIRHFLIETEFGDKFDVVEYPEYQKLQQENKKLKEQLGKYKIELEKADSITQSCIFDGKKESKISYRKLLNLVKKNKTQQKEFIEYMNKVIKELELLETGPRINNIDEELNGYLIQRVNTFKEILSKYKEIIGVDNE